MKPLIISAPFGNYIQPSCATPTLGTFTLEPRPGRLWAILTRIWAYPSLGGYVNKIGLRNPGLMSLQGKDVTEEIISIHGFSNQDWHSLLSLFHTMAVFTAPLALELNFSCPNVTDEPIHYFSVIAAAKKFGFTVIVKLPPIDYESMVSQSRDAGVLFFHCCNTLPMPNGGMSGRPLKPYSLRVVRHLRATFGEACTIIGGGGIFTTQDVRAYFEAGANHVAIGSSLLNPFRLRNIPSLAEAASWCSKWVTPPSPIPTPS